MELHPKRIMAYRQFREGQSHLYRTQIEILVVDDVWLVSLWDGYQDSGWTTKYFDSLEAARERADELSKDWSVRYVTKCWKGYPLEEEEIH